MKNQQQEPKLPASEFVAPDVPRETTGEWTTIVPCTVCGGAVIDNPESIANRRHALCRAPERATAEQIMAGALAPDGVLRLNVTVTVDVREFANWPPRCVSAFMAGVAQCLGAEAYAREAGNGRKSPGQQNITPETT